MIVIFILVITQQTTIYSPSYVSFPINSTMDIYVSLEWVGHSLTTRCSSLRFIYHWWPTYASVGKLVSQITTNSFAIYCHHRDMLFHCLSVSGIFVYNYFTHGTICQLPQKYKLTHQLNPIALFLCCGPMRVTVRSSWIHFCGTYQLTALIIVSPPKWINQI
jgi:hypothetical protein